MQLELQEFSRNGRCRTLFVCGKLVNHSREHQTSHFSYMDNFYQFFVGCRFLLLQTIRIAVFMVALEFVFFGHKASWLTFKNLCIKIVFLLWSWSRVPSFLKQIADNLKYLIGSTDGNQSFVRDNCTSKWMMHIAMFGWQCTIGLALIFNDYYLRPNLI